ncbi:MAG: hypothetical protein JNK49_07005 [Planctomycetes bacterium]|nr:hypothetical protein [Planctomycetota bacterium]
MAKSHPPPPRKLTERVLAGAGQLPLASLLEWLVPVAALRGLARRFGLTPKGGFRLEKAPAHVLAPLLAELRDPEQLDAVFALLVPEAPANPPAPVAAEAPAETLALLALREAELARTHADLAAAREAAQRAREREADLARRLAAAEEDLARGAQGARPMPVLRAEPETAALAHRLHELEAERDGWQAADAALRRQLAHNQSRMRELEQQAAELEALLPKGRRRRPPPPEPEPDRRFRVPYFEPSFYKSLVGKERKAVERAVQAVLLFCTEGHAYPGLEVKQLGGQDTWSLRASLGLRVYFRQRDDGDIEVLEIADREDQHTTLRRLKERQ